MTTVTGDLLLRSGQDLEATVARRLREFGLTVTLPGGGAHEDITDHVAQALAAFLRLPLGTLLFWAWERQPAVRRACLETAGRVGAVQQITVTEHDLESVQRPSLHLDLGGRRMLLLDVVVRLGLHLRSVVVTVEEGQVIGTTSAETSCLGQLTVSLPGGSPRLVLDHTEPALRLPAYTFRDSQVHEVPDSPGPQPVAQPSASDAVAVPSPGPRPEGIVPTARTHGEAAPGTGPDLAGLVDRRPNRAARAEVPASPEGWYWDGDRMRHWTGSGWKD